jgi:hypothetical protein
VLGKSKIPVGSRRLKAPRLPLPRNFLMSVPVSTLPLIHYLLCLIAAANGTVCVGTRVAYRAVRRLRRVKPTQVGRIRPKNRHPVKAAFEGETGSPKRGSEKASCRGNATFDTTVAQVGAVLVGGTTA